MYMLHNFDYNYIPSQGLMVHEDCSVCEHSLTSLLAICYKNNNAANNPKICDT